MTGCIFCAIVREEIPSHRVFEDETSVAFLDTRPVFLGHTLVVPRVHHEMLTDLPPELITPFFTTVQRIAGAMVTGLGAHGSFVATNSKVSQSVPHFHVHIVPRRTKDGLRGFFWPRQKYKGDDEAAEFASRLREGLRQVGES